MGTELMTLESVVKKWPILDPTQDSISILTANLGGEKITPGDLGKIKMPSGGVTSWVFGDDTLKEVVGVILHIEWRRAYWARRGSGGKPSCSSSDCITGKGDPGGDCDTCPLNEWGTAIGDDGSPRNGKACKEQRLVYILREGEYLPDVVYLPGSSIDPFKKWKIRLKARFDNVAVKLTLVKDVSDDGHAFARLVCTTVSVLHPDVAGSIRKYAAGLAGVFKAHSDNVDAENYD